MLRMRTTGSAIAVLLALVVLAFAFTGCGSGSSKPAPTGGTYKIGAVLSTSGPAAPLGTPEQQALLLLEKQINAKGGIDGKKVQFIIEDDASDPASATVAINKLITQDKVLAVIGSSSTGATLAMVPTAEKDKVALVCCAAGTKITQPVNAYIFRTPPTDSMALTKVLEYLKNTLKVKKVAVLHDANAFGTGGAEELVAKAPGYGIQIVSREQYNSTDTDMTAQLTKIQQANPEALVVWGTNPGPASIAKNMQTLGMKIPYIGSHGIANQSFIKLAGPAADGVVFPGGKLLIPSTIPAGSAWATAVADFSKAFQAEYNAPINSFAAHGYDAGNIIIEAIKKAGADPVAIASQIEKTKAYVGIDGTYTYTPTNHDGLSTNDLVMIKIENGKWVVAK
jgi:branched-chain amino acid transport system substrate-binding protein